MRGRMRLRYGTTGKRLLQLLGVLFVLQSFIDLLPLRAPKDDLTRRNEKIFIASIHWNNEEILRSHWINAILDLCEDLGPKNVYVSIQESGSWDNSKDALRVLKNELVERSIPHKVILDETTHAQEISRTPAESGWIKTPRDKIELRRIPYLARLRNLVLEPLNVLAKTGQHFDKILWVNDVVFTTDDVRRLLNTRNGDYAAACSLDFAKPPQFYDTFALRDSSGHDQLMQTWPYFRSSKSRNALKANRPVPVKSCWNGITAFDAAPFYDPKQPLRFRGISDDLALKHLEGSECCLIHADNPLTATKKVWLNPNVRVGYNPKAYDIVNPKSHAKWVSASERLYWSWENRLKRWLTTHWFKESMVTRRVRSWQNPKYGRVEPGTACLINEMQVLIENGWAHV